jgi:hypothetical protein
MRKLKLESLQVQSFATTAAAPVWHGTVQAHADSGEPTCVCRLSEDGGCQSWDPAVCNQTGSDCNNVSTDFASCLDAC